MSEIAMPRLSDTMQGGTIIRWLKSPGDEIKKGDVLAEIETDKATMDLEAYEAGTLQQILVQEGETVPIGQVVALIGTGAAIPQPAQHAAATAKAGADGAAPTPTPVASQPKAEASNWDKGPIPIESGKRGAVKASPLARRMAEEHGIDLRQVQGTGPDGRIVRDDIEDMLEQLGTAPAPAAPMAAPQAAASPQAMPVPAALPDMPAQEAEIVKLSRVQLLIARRLTESKQTIPHFYVSSEVDMTDALALRQTFNASVGEESGKVTVNDFIVRACALALEKFPEVNSTIKDDQLIKYKHINVGIAVDVPSGLVVPVIRETNLKGLRTIAREAKALIARARANKLAPVDLEEGTFSVSNLGMMDVSEFIAVINPPQSAILAISSVRQRFVPVDGQPVIRDLMTMTLSADHRILYGATVARFLQEVKRLMQKPYSLLG
jgi:pyruvate dehydrogenase E2 component (dihydrolipoamide acetyltransferase)